MKVAIIPARGGSKRIPRKNIKQFAGQPMIAYAIRAAVGCGLFNKVIVSTDDIEIAEIAKGYGAEVPFMRPVELADDNTPTVPVVAHAIRTLQQQGVSLEYACCIYPGVPFIQTSDLIAAFELLKTCGAGYCYPVTEFPSVIQRALRRFPDGKIQPINPQYEWTRTQDLESAFYDAGQFYWGKVSSWLDGLGLQSHGSGLLIPQWRVVDIDTPEDWHRAELLHTVLCREVH
ncbi:MAG: pseudaminic acid cytidylyltransferase [Magnetococcus sp. THC-1_WYH]